MKIRIFYIFIAIIVVVTLLVLRAKIANIKAEAGRVAFNQRKNDLIIFKQHSKNISKPILATFHGWNLIKGKKYEEAEIILERVVELDPNYRDGELYLGYTRLKILEQSSKSGQKPVFTRTALDQQKKLNEADSALHLAQKIDPLYPLTNQLLAKVSEKRDNDKEVKLWYARYKEVGGN